MPSALLTTPQTNDLSLEGGKKRTWIQAVQMARDELNITGFVAIRKGEPLYERAKKHYGNRQIKKSPKKTRKMTWIQAVQKARKKLNITGFVAVRKGGRLYKLAKKYYDM